MVDNLGVRIAHNKEGSAYIAGLYGPTGVSRKLQAMGLERNKWQKWVKQAAQIVARRASLLAPKDSGNLARSIGGFAGKRVTSNNQPARYLFGGVVIAQPSIKTIGKNAQGEATGRRAILRQTFTSFEGKEVTEKVSYGKAISFGRYYPDSGKRTRGNPYLRRARDQTRYNVVKMWNREIKQWIETNGFDTEGLGG